MCVVSINIPEEILLDLHENEDDFAAYAKCMPRQELSFSSGSADYGTGRRTFSDTGYDIDTPTYSQSIYNADNEFTIQYFTNGASCSEDEFHNLIPSVSIYKTGKGVLKNFVFVILPCFTFM